MSFELAYSHWCAALVALGFAVGSHLNPPATEYDLEHVEQRIGFALPEDLKELYRKADGQTPPFGLKDAAPGSVVMPFFGSYDFIPLSDALRQYESWKQIYDEAGDDFDADFNEGIISVRGADPVYPEYWRPGWFPFSIDGGGNSYAVDLSPPPAGVYGQVIVIGPDEDVRRVLAPSLTALLSFAATLRLEFQEANGVWRMFDLERFPPK